MMALIIMKMVIIVKIKMMMVMQIIIIIIIIIIITNSLYQPDDFSPGSTTAPVWSAFLTWCPL